MHESTNITRRNLLTRCLGVSVAVIAGTIIKRNEHFGSDFELAGAQKVDSTKWQNELQKAKQYPVGSEECLYHTNQVLEYAGYRANIDATGASTAVGAYQTLARSGLKIDGWNGPLTQQSILDGWGLNTWRLPIPFPDGAVIIKRDRIMYTILDNTISSISMIAVAEEKVRPDYINGQLINDSYFTPTGWFKAGNTADANAVSSIDNSWPIPYYTGLENSNGQDNGIGLHGSNNVFVELPNEAEIGKNPFRYFSHGCIRLPIPIMQIIVAELDTMRHANKQPQVLCVTGSKRLADLERWDWKSHGNVQDPGIEALID